MVRQPVPLVPTARLPSRASPSLDPPSGKGTSAPTRVQGPRRTRSAALLPPAHARRLARKRDLQAILLRGGRREAASRLAGCGMLWRVGTCDDCGHPQVTGPSAIFTCDLRLCPFCSRRRQARLRRRLSAALPYLRSPKLLTLTIANVRRLTPRIFDRVRGWFRMLRRRKLLRGVRGGAYALEATWSFQNGWNVHLHVIIDSPYIPQKLIARAWREITGTSYVVDIRSIVQGKASRAAAIPLRKAVEIVVEYITKNPWDFGWSDDAVIEYLDATRRKRLFDTFGSLRGRKNSLEEAGLVDVVFGTGPKPVVCDACGGSRWTCIGVFHLYRLPEVLAVDLPGGDLPGSRPVAARSISAWSSLLGAVG